MSQFKDLIKLEPIDVTQLLTTILIILTVVVFFRGQVNDFIADLRDRPITVEMSGSTTRVQLGAVVSAVRETVAVPDPPATDDRINRLQEIVREINDMQGIRKSGTDQLFAHLATLEREENAVIDFVVDNPDRGYYDDAGMLRYLSIASQQVPYLAFYDVDRFVGVIRTRDVISGLASSQPEFANFGEKLKNGEWQHFPTLLTPEMGFTAKPTIAQLQQRLTESGLDELPLSESSRLVGFLDYRSVANDLYARVSAAGP